MTRRMNIAYCTLQYLCAKHFEESQFTNKKYKDRLNWNAVPTLFEMPNPPKLIKGKRKHPRDRPQTVSIGVSISMILLFN